MNNLIQGFKAVTLSFSSESIHKHQLFIKEHSVKTFDEDKPPGRTLFVLNLPPYTTKDNLKQVFSKIGQVISVTIPASKEENANQEGFKFAYVVFDSHATLQQALKVHTLGCLSDNNKPITLGMNKWAAEYNNSILDHQQLNETVNKFISEYDQQQESSKNAVTDDDGWTVVTKKGRNPGLSRKQSVENKLIEKSSAKTKKRELKNFYTFQIKEEKMKHIVALRKSFQESKEKVAAMKSMRNFKPLS